MGRFGFLSVFISIVLVHVLILRSYLVKIDSISKPNAQIRHITLSRVIIKKPQPPKLNIPKITPSLVQKPIIKPLPRPKLIHKPKRKKHLKHKKTIQQKIVSKVLQQPKPIPKIETKAPIKQINTTSIKDKYTSEIRRQIKKNLFYPKIAKRMHIQDIVEVSFRVLSDGQISNIKIVNHPRKVLSRGAIKTLHALNLAPIPKELHQTYMDITIPIEFKLTKG